MLFTEHDLAQELAAQIKHTDLGVTNAEEVDVVSYGNVADLRTEHAVETRLDNGQRFQLVVRQVGGPFA